ncbi:MAG: hypothetical protein HGA36_00125 [Candidatus Moranbacteria bacterium]|nr:hypothetical protein [Candidatus Moranbacteria bacterium]
MKVAIKILMVFLTASLCGCMVYAVPGSYIAPVTYQNEVVPPHCRPCGNGQICCTAGTPYYMNPGVPIGGIFIEGGGHSKRNTPAHVAKPRGPTPFEVVYGKGALKEKKRR